MTDVKKLRKLAEKATLGQKYFTVEDTFPTMWLVDEHGERHDITNDDLIFWESANPQAIIGLLDMVDRYREALHSCEVRSGHIENWHRDHVTPDNFKDCQDVGVTPEAYLRETKMIARKALEGGK